MGGCTPCKCQQKCQPEEKGCKLDQEWCTLKCKQPTNPPKKTKPPAKQPTKPPTKKQKALLQSNQNNNRAVYTQAWAGDEPERQTTTKETTTTNLPCMCRPEEKGCKLDQEWCTLMCKQPTNPPNKTKPP